MSFRNMVLQEAKAPDDVLTTAYLAARRALPQPTLDLMQALTHLHTSGLCTRQVRAKLDADPCYQAAEQVRRLLDDEPAATEEGRR